MGKGHFAAHRFDQVEGIRILLAKQGRVVVVVVVVGIDD